MRRLIWISAAAVAVVCVVGTGRSPAADARACGGFSVTSLTGRSTYTVQVVEGALTCDAAVGLMYRVAVEPHDYPAGWRCLTGEDRRSWAISCTGHGATVRAYGPIAHTGSWAQVVAQATMHVAVPRTTLGLSLTSVTGGQRCGGSGSPAWISAGYTREDGAMLAIAEGSPHTCGQLGGVNVVATWKIHSAAAQLSENCVPTGCARLAGEWTLDWSEHGTEITLWTHRLNEHELLAVARGMAFQP